MTKQDLAVNGHKLHIQIRGPAVGQPLLLLHHGLGSIRSWRKLVPDLISAGYRTVSYDRWGYGKSGERPALDLPHFDKDQEDLLALLDALEVEQAVLVGHSDGGTLALYFAAAHPERVKILVVVAAHIYVEPKMLLGIEGIRHTYRHDDDFYRRFRRVHGDKYNSVFDNWYNGWGNPQHLDWDMRPVLASISCPSLVVQGLEDEHATPQHARDLAASLPGSQLVLVPGAGHMLPQDHPEIFNPVLLDYLNGFLSCSIKS